MTAEDDPTPDAFRTYSEFEDEMLMKLNASAQHWARYYAKVFAEADAVVLERVAVQALRPWLRWAAPYPGVMRLLRAAGLWRPPTACYEHGRLIGFTKDGMREYPEPPDGLPAFTVGRYGGTHSWTLERLPWWHWRSLRRRVKGWFS